MKKTFYSKLFKVLIRLFLGAILIFSATYLQTYWAMGKFSGKISSSCLECSFADDVLMASVLTSIFLTTLFYFLSSVKINYIKIAIEFLLLVFVWLFWNYTIFVERESSWSTYLFKEEIYYTISISILPTLLLSFTTIVLINYKYFLEKIRIKRNALPILLILSLALTSCRNTKQPTTSESKAVQKAVESSKVIVKDTLQNNIELKKKLKTFIPKGYVIYSDEGGIFTEGWGEIKGDLNKDGLEDIVLIIKGNDKDQIIQDENRGKLDRNRRGIIVLLNKGNHYEIAAKNYNCFSSENEDGGVYFAPELSVNINKGKLNIDYGHGRYGSWGYTFKYQNGNMELIGYDSYSNRGPIPQYEESINFLTKKKLTRDNLNKDDDVNDEVKFKDTWENITVKKLIKLHEIKDFDALSF